MVSGINIIIPMAGLGSRYSKVGYKVPKPLVKILACPMIVWVLRHVSIREEDKIFLALRKEVDSKYGVSQMLKREFPRFNIVPIRLRDITRGAAETIALVIACMDQEDLLRPTLSLDCDTIYFEDIVDYFRMVSLRLSPGSGICACFKDMGRIPMYSYIRTDYDNAGQVTAIAEKKKISNLANTGAYGFPSARILDVFLRRLLKKPVPAIGEYYISAVIADMIQDGIKFLPLLVNTFQCVGTPDQLLEFLSAAKRSIQLLSLLSIPRKTLVFDVESVHTLSDRSTLTVAQLQKYLPESSKKILRGLRDIGYAVTFSMKSGFCPHLTSAKDFKFVGLAERRLAQVEDRFFPLDHTLPLAIGY